MLEMLQTLLADRFKLTMHGEKRELPVFALERSRRDGAFGQGVRPTACPDAATDLSGPRPCMNIQTGVGFLTLRGMPLNQFTAYLAPYVNRVIVDRTGSRWPLRHRAEVDAGVSGPGSRRW